MLPTSASPLNSQLLTSTHTFGKGWAQAEHPKRFAWFPGFWPPLCGMGLLTDVIVSNLRHEGHQVLHMLAQVCGWAGLTWLALRLSIAYSLVHVQACSCSCNPGTLQGLATWRSSMCFPCSSRPRGRQPHPTRSAGGSNRSCWLLDWTRPPSPTCPATPAWSGLRLPGELARKAVGKH